MPGSGDPFIYPRARIGRGAATGLDRRERTANAAERPFGALKAQLSAARTPVQRAAERLTRLASSTVFLIAHVVWLTAWIVLNSGVLGSIVFDPFPFGLLTLVLSIEAIFLTIFVLMSQGREAAIAELREEMTLQVILRVEGEVTKSLQLMAGLYARLDVPLGDEKELRDMLQPLDPEEIKKSLETEIEDVDRDDKADSEAPDGEQAVADPGSQADEDGG